MTESYTTTAEYVHIDTALKSFWKPFNELLDEMVSFEPQPLSAFDGRLNRLAERIRSLNPNMSDAEILKNAEMDISAMASEETQFQERFSERFMTMQVTVSLLSQALCEALINAVLAVGLYENGAADQFVKIEKYGIKKKWLECPKKFCPKYELRQDSGLFMTLCHLVEQRNAWIHHKSHLEADQKKIIEGSQLQSLPYVETAKWIKRYFSLPYDLAEHAHTYTRQAVAVILVYNRQPIPIADAHKLLTLESN